MGSKPPPATAAGSIVEAYDPVILARLPLLHEYLCATSYGDGAPRITSSLIVFTEAGGWKVCLSDRDTDRVLWAAADDLTGLLDAIDARLRSVSPDWRLPTKRRK